MDQQQRKVWVIGAGGVGFYLSLALSRAGIEHIVFDTDDLQGGLGWSRMPKASPTTKKTALLRGFTLAVMGDRAPTMIDAKFNGDECGEGDLVVDCSDMPLTARKIIWERARKQGARLLRVSYDGKNNIVAVAEGLPLFGRQGGGYQNLPGLDLSFVAGGIGCMTVRKILSGHEAHIEFQVSVDELILGHHSAASVEIVSKPVCVPKRRSRKVATSVQPTTKA